MSNIVVYPILVGYLVFTVHKRELKKVFTHLKLMANIMGKIPWQVCIIFVVFNVLPFQQEMSSSFITLRS